MYRLGFTRFNNPNCLATVPEEKEDKESLFAKEIFYSVPPIIYGLLVYPAWVLITRRMALDKFREGIIMNRRNNFNYVNDFSQIFAR